MASFMLDLAAITPALEIISSFQNATDERKSPTEGGSGDANSSMQTLMGSFRDSMTSCASPEVAIPHQLFSFISPADRPSTWKELLGVPIPNGDEYSQLCQLDAKEFDAKIRDDAFRTFKGNSEFWAKVDEATIIRVLKALSVQFGYVQGMNVLLGPFLYIMPEEEAFWCITNLLRDHMPRYVLKNLDGAHSGTKLFGRCLQRLDAKLYNHIIAKMGDMSIFALRYVLTLFANSRPLDEVLKLWDATFAIGPHFNIMLLCAKIMLLREPILKEKRASKIIALIEDAPIVSHTLIDGAFCLLRFIPSDLLEELHAHATGLAPLLSPSRPVTTTGTEGVNSVSVAKGTHSAEGRVEGTVEGGGFGVGESGMGSGSGSGVGSPVCSLHINSYSVSNSQSCDSPAPTFASRDSPLFTPTLRAHTPTLPALHTHALHTRPLHTLTALTPLGPLTPSPLSHAIATHTTHATFPSPPSTTAKGSLGAFASHDTDHTDHSSGSPQTTPNPRSHTTHTNKLANSADTTHPSSTSACARSMHSAPITLLPLKHQSRSGTARTSPSSSNNSSSCSSMDADDSTTGVSVGNASGSAYGSSGGMSGTNVSTGVVVSVKVSTKSSKSVVV